ncbi:MAG: hypothetical protein QXM16_03220 [Nitrososphaerota archaeon]
MARLDLDPPRDIHVLAIEVDDPYTISEKVSERLASRLEELSEEILRRIKATLPPRSLKTANAGIDS